MKRAMAVLLAAVLMSSMLAGCGSPAGPAADAGQDGQQNEMHVPEKGADTTMGGSGNVTEPAPAPAPEKADPVEDPARSDPDPGSDEGRPEGGEASGDAIEPIDEDGMIDIEAAQGDLTLAADTVGFDNVSESSDMPDDSFDSIQDELVALSSGGFTYSVSAVSLGNLQASNQYGFIDYSYTSDGYIVVKYTAATSKRLKAIVKGPGTSYTYNLNVGEQTTLPLSDGNGRYTVTLYENAYGTKYAAMLSQSFDVSLSNEFGPFLHSNQYVNYDAAPNTVATAADLCGRSNDLLGKVANVYGWVVGNISYDYNKARTVQSGYLPVLDTVLANRTGICFDYAALMAGMLRSQGIPCKLVVGYAGTAYHAWISVWSNTDGWIEGVIYFDGTSW